jgi:ribonucleoside-diphosphate reductase alpha chain
MAAKSSEAHLSANALTVLARRYLKKDDQGNVVESPEELFRRVADNIAQADYQYNGQRNIRGTEEEFYRVLSNLDFLPNPRHR